MDSQYYRKQKRSFSLKAVLSRAMRNRTLMLGLLFSLPVCFFILFSNRGVLKRMNLEDEKRDMTEKVRMAELEHDRLAAQSKALDADQHAIEKVAREKHGMIRDGETVYKVKKSK
ncbi:MAG TPA: septum formation initiator family protein [Bacteroidota bacterium]|nr:septum formation initiator family protein [Bacteroidota bacterium]